MKFSVPRVPKSINSVGQHWGWRHSEKEKWLAHFAVHKAKAPDDFAFYHKARRIIRVRVFWGKPGVLPDQDNIIAGLKPVIDALKGLGFIWDDSPEWVEVIYEPVVRDRKSYTEFEIE